MNLRWESIKNQDINGEKAYLGKWVVGSVFYDGITSDEKKWKVNCHLPGIKKSIGNFSEKEEGKVILDEAVRHWMVEASVIAIIAET